MLKTLLTCMILFSAAASAKDTVTYFCPNNHTVTLTMRQDGIVATADNKDTVWSDGQGFYDRPHDTNVLIFGEKGSPVHIILAQSGHHRATDHSISISVIDGIDPKTQTERWSFEGCRAEK